MTTTAARRRRFARPDSAPEGSPLRDLSYAYHIDAGRYARHLRLLAVGLGVTRIEGIVERVEQDAHSGNVTALHTHRGERIAGDLFLDCSGMRALLIQGALQTGVHDLAHLLPCDRAWTVPSAAQPVIDPSTRCTARAAGWQWRIPLQHRVGNGHVFCSEFISEDEAHDTLVRNLDGEALTEAKLIKFRTGRSKRAWNRNVIAVGLSAGFLEPLEATTIHIILNTLNKIIGHLPRKGIDPYVVNEFNRQMDLQFDTIKDFLVLHYHQSPGRTEPLWQYFHSLELPDRILVAMERFRRSARIEISQWDQFKSANWFSVSLGQGIMPEDYDPLADNVGGDALVVHMATVRSAIARTAAGMPTHEAYIRANCAAPNPA